MPTKTTAPISHRLLSAAFARLDGDGDGEIAARDLRRFMATTPAAGRYDEATCAFLHCWLRQQSADGRVDLGAFLSVADTSFEALRAESVKIGDRGRRPTITRQLSHIHTRALRHDTIETLFTKYFVQPRP